jgi:UDP-N-acetylglucosamine diphosphorylase / glucose-1-phosphate thymidylyltransferase / UDP-N-acetylgalactosamine diphosphorylase / glucosamine-1-phosphate N-acetyltransferase / galactosamine-1-phosphate N-acetyltransferase
MLSPKDFFDLSKFEFSDIFDDCEYVWDVLKKIGDYILRKNLIGIHCDLPESVVIEGNEVYIGKGTKVEPQVYIKSPTIIGENCEIRQGAYIRGNCVAGKGSIIGHATEVKNSVFLCNSHAPHFNYVGDSVLGHNTNLGAGTKLSNYKISSDKFVKLIIEGKMYDTGLNKFGAIMGDNSESGCNSVLAPGTIVGRNSLIYPNAFARGYIPPDTIIKLKQNFVTISRRS